MSFLRRLFKSEKPVVYIVSGLPRSGTSMMMKMLEAGGLPPLTDGLREADTDNPKGYYEFERVKQLDKGDTEWLAQAQGKAVKVISALLKYLPEDYAYQIVFMERDISEVLASQRKMLVHRGEDPDSVDEVKMATLFTNHVKKVKAYLAEQDNMSILYVHYNDVLADPYPQAQSVSQFLGNRPDVQAMVEIVDPNLHRNRKEMLATS
jgi:LPS sulfotransferase NodH